MAVRDGKKKIEFLVGENTEQVILVEMEHNGGTIDTTVTEYRMVEEPDKRATEISNEFFTLIRLTMEMMEEVKKATEKQFEALLQPAEEVVEETSDEEYTGETTPHGN